MTSYLADAIAQVNRTPQSTAIPGREAEMVQNAAGGYTFEVDDFARLNRFLILGSEGGTYYVGEPELTTENARGVISCLQQDGPKTVNQIVEISTAGRAAKNDPALFALALACTPDFADDETRKQALAAIPRVARTGTHLFTFCSFIDNLRGWGRGLRNAIASWYEDKDPDKLAYQVIKYRQRNGWTHRDVLRLSHPSDGAPRGFYRLPDSDPRKIGTGPAPVELKSAVYDWICGRESDHLPEPVVAFEAAQNASNVAELVDVVQTYGNKVPHEALPNDLKANADVWGALLDAGMPIGALVRNLGNMTRYGLLTPNSDAARSVVSQLSNEEAIRRSRIHPLNVLIALKTYESGGGFRSGNQWRPVASIVDALDDLFYASFGNVEPTGKRRLIAVDTSGSMWGSTGGWGFPNCTGASILPPRLAAAAMAMVSIKSGDPTEVVAFSSGTGYQPGLRNRFGTSGVASLPISERLRLDAVLKAFETVPAGGTDCALPMLYADAEGRQVDIFEVYTDNETWAGQIHPSQALRQYRRHSGIDAKLAVIAMVSSSNTIADPNDAGMLDLVGFDTATPQVLSAFARGEI